MKTLSYTLAVYVLSLFTLLSAQSPRGDIRGVLHSGSSNQVYVHTTKGLYLLSENNLDTALVILENQYNPDAIDLAFAERLLLLYRSGAVKLWSPDLTGSYQLSKTDGKPIRACAETAVDQYSVYLAVSAGGDDIYLCGARDGRLIRTLPGSAGAVSELCFDPTGQYLAARWEKGDIKVWRLKDGAVVAKWNTLPGKSRALTFHPYKNVLAFSDGAKLCFADVTKGNEWFIDQGVNDYIMSLAYHPERDQLAVATVRGEVQLWQPSTGRFLASLQHGKRELVDITYNKRGDILISADAKRIRFWRPANGEMISHMALGEK